jgi:hypothetical protein
MNNQNTDYITITPEEYQQYHREWVLWTQGQLSEEHTDESTHQKTA